MRYDNEHKQKTHQKLLYEASLAIRENGPNNVAVAGVMAKAGLTHGGFYAHFKSKDHLVAETISYMFDEQIESFKARMEGDSLRDCLLAYIERYLSMQHRELVDRGCPMAALNSDIGRMSDAVRTQFELGIKKSITVVADILNKLGKSESHAMAASILSEMIGALSVARGVLDAELSQSILNAAKENIKARI